jgi:hypothetical protein
MKKQIVINLYEYFLKHIYQVVLLLYIIIYFIPIILFSNNFPFYNDDYQTILDFLNNYEMSIKVFEKLNLLFAQHNEHRVVFTRICSLLDYKVFGELNFKRLIIIGSLGLPVLLYFLYRTISEKTNLNSIVFFSISIFMLNYSYWEVSFWPMASLQNIWVNTFALISIYLISTKNNYYFLILALLFGTIATYTSGNGIFVFIVGNLTLYFKKDKLYRNLLIWNLYGILIFTVYFTFYQKVPHHPDIIQTLQLHKATMYNFFFMLLGSGIDISNKYLSFFIGNVILLLSIFLVYKKYYKINPVLSAFMLFLLFTIASCTLGRAAFGEEAALMPRYSLVAVIYISILACAYFEIYYKEEWIENHKFIVIFFLPICYVNYTYILNKEEPILRRNYFLEQAEIAKAGISESDFNYLWSGNDKNIPIQILKKSDSLNIFKSVFSSKYSVMNLPDLTNIKSIKFDIESFEETDSTVVCFGWAIQEQIESLNLNIFYVLTDDIGNQACLKHTIKTQRDYVNSAYNKENKFNYLDCGFHILINKSDYPIGKYLLSIYISDGKTKSKLSVLNTFSVTK